MLSFGGLRPPRITSSSPPDESVRLADKGLLDPPSADSGAAYFLGFSTGHQSDDHRDNHEDHHREENLRRRENTASRRWGRSCWWRVFRRQLALRILHPLHRVVIVRLYFQRCLIIGDRLVILHHRATRGASLHQRILVIRTLLQERRVIFDRRRKILQVPVRPGAPVITLWIVRIFLDRHRKVSDRFIPLRQSNVGKTPELVAERFVAL